MQINNISYTTFESKTPKKRFITPGMKSSIEAILLKMNSAVKRVEDGDYYKTTINTKVHYNNGEYVFEDERRLKEKIPFEQQMQGYSVLKLGKKTVLDINNENGEIIDYIKPSYKPFFLVLKQAEKILLNIRTNFNLSEVIKKEFLTLSDLTPEGSRKMKKFVLQTEKQRLENVIKDLENISK